MGGSDGWGVPVEVHLCGTGFLRTGGMLQCVEGPADGIDGMQMQPIMGAKERAGADHRQLRRSCCFINHEGFEWKLCGDVAPCGASGGAGGWVSQAPLSSCQHCTMCSSYQHATWQQAPAVSTQDDKNGQGLGWHEQGVVQSHRKAQGRKDEV